MTDVKIKCDSCKFVDGCVDYGWSECKKFTQKPSEPMTKLCNSCEYLRYCARSGIEEVGCDRYKRDTTTNEEWLRSATFEEMAGAIYEWHSAGYTKGRLGLGLNSVTEVIEWLKQPHREERENEMS